MFESTKTLKVSRIQIILWQLLRSTQIYSASITTVPKALRSLLGILGRSELLQVSVGPLRMREGRGGVPVAHDDPS